MKKVFLAFLIIIVSALSILLVACSSNQNINTNTSSYETITTNLNTEDENIETTSFSFEKDTTSSETSITETNDTTRETIEQEIPYEIVMTKNGVNCSIENSIVLKLRDLEQEKTFSDLGDSFYINVYGKYGSSYAIMTGSLPTSQNNDDYTEIVAGIVFDFKKPSHIKIYQSDDIYSLTDAYNSGLISKDDLQDIYNKFFVSKSFDKYVVYNKVIQVAPQITAEQKAMYDIILDKQGNNCLLNDEIVLELREIEQEKTSYNIKDSFYLKVYGQYDSAYAVMIGNTLQSINNTDYTEIVGGVSFYYSNGPIMKLYYNKRLYSLTDAYSKGLISKEDLQELHNNLYYKKSFNEYHVCKKSFGPSDYKIEKSSEISLSDEMIWKINDSFLKSRNYSNQIRYGVKYYGEYDSCYALMFSMTGLETIGDFEIIDDLFFNYGSVEEHLKIYKDGVFYSLSDAYKQGIVSYEILKDLSVKVNENRYDTYNIVLNIQ